MKPNLYHYTRLTNLKMIMADGYLKPTYSSFDITEKPAVWATFSEEFELTAYPMWITNDEVIILSWEQFCLKDTPCRIELDQSIEWVKWSQWRKTSNVRSKIIKSLELHTIKRNSNSMLHRCHFDKVTSDKWLSIQCFVNGGWQPYQVEEMAVAA